MQARAFDIDTTDIDRPDVFVAEVFTDEWDTRRAILDGDTYDAKEIIKFDWETTHHDYIPARGAWVVDEDSLEELEAQLADAGFSFGYDYDDIETPGVDDLAEVVEFAAADDRIEVTYQKKTGSGTSSYAGRLRHAEGPDDPFTNGPLLAFDRDEDGHRMRIKIDRNEKVALFTHGSHAPYVGRVEEITIDPVGERGEVDA